MSFDFKACLGRLATGAVMDEAESEAAFSHLLSGAATHGQLGAFLMALKLRGETVAEIAGGVRALRGHMISVAAPEGAIDTCGTGGDTAGTYNISTAAAIVVAACGVPVAKHGNRAVSSLTGAADVMEALGLNLDTDAKTDEAGLNTLGIAFLPATRHHMAMRHIGPVRKELGFRSIFNLVGPLSNPARTRRQLMGVYDRAWLRPVAEVHQRLGADHVWVVHGEDGLDELTTTGVSHVAELKNGEIREFQVTPEDAGLLRATMNELKGGDPAHNAAALRALLDGAPGAYRDIVLLNAAAALIVGGKADNLKDGAAMAARAIDSGAARALLDRWTAFSKEHS